jgi:hypothetical protein
VRGAHEWTVDPEQTSPAAPPPAAPPPRAEPPPLTADAPPPWAAAPPLVAEARRRAAARFSDDDDEDDWRQKRAATPAPALDRTAIAAWAASVFLLFGLVVAVVAFRADIMRAWPPSQRLLALFDAVPR